MTTKNDELDEMPAEVDFRGGTRGKYYRDYQSMRRTAVLEPDVASWFPTDKAVNEALRQLIEAGAVDPDDRS